MNTQLLVKAINFAAIAHRNQRRKDEGKTPYINHPIEVMSLLSSCDICDVSVLCGAVLHDTIEDTDVTYNNLVENFGNEIADIVKECSDDKNLNKIERKKLQIEHASSCSDKAKLVKCADKLSNLMGLLSTPPSFWSPEEINGYFLWAFAVWKNIRGVNENIDKLLYDIFDQKGFHNLSSEQLQYGIDLYYTIINHSE